MRAPLILGLIAVVGVGAFETSMASTKPVPGVGIVVKKNPGTGADFGGPLLPPIPADFFNPGSEPFVGEVRLLGPYGYTCFPCDDDGDSVPTEAEDSRIDYLEDTPSEPFVVELAPIFLRSEDPIQVHTGGVESFFDVFVTISGQVPLADAPAIGTLLLQPGQSLDSGAAAVVLESHVDVRCTFTFANASSGEPAGSAIVQDLRLHLQDVGLPITRVADGTPDGYIVMGLGGMTTLPFTFASTGGEFRTTLRSIFVESPVSTAAQRWGAVKGQFH